MSRPLALLLIVTAGVFAPLLGAALVWDDPTLVLENTWTDSLGGALQGFTGSLWGGVPGHIGGEGFYRPMMLIELAIDRALFHRSPVGHHLHSLLWHLGVVALTWRWLRGLGLPTLMGAAVVALHPLQAEGVAFIAARNDLMATAGLLGVWILLEDKAPDARRLAGAGLCMLYALLSKESAVIGIPALVVLDMARWGRPSGIARYGALVAPTLLWLGLRTAAVEGGPTLALDPSLWLTALSRDLALLLWPFGMTPAATLSTLAPAWGLAGLSAGLLAALGGLGGRLGVAALALFALAMGPALAGAVLSDSLAWRYLYLPLLGVALTIAAFQARPPTRPPKPGVGVAKVALLGLITAMSLGRWSDNLSFWKDAHTNAPSAHTACGLFKVHEAREDAARAWPLLQEALQPPPSGYCCFSATRFPLDALGPPTAVRSGRDALAAGCAPTPELLAPLALAEALSGDWEAAELHARAIDGDPWGYTPVIRSAAALRRGDDRELRAWEERGTGREATPLRRQVEWLLAQGQ